MQTDPAATAEDKTRRDIQEAGDRLRARQVELLFDQLPVVLAASAAAALILTGILWPVAPASLLCPWLFLLIVSVALRNILISRYRQSVDRQERAGYWLAWFVAGSLASGIIWDGAIIFLAIHGSIFHIGIAVLWICGLTAGSVAALSSIKGVFFSFSIPALVPGAVFLLSTGGKDEAIISGAMFLFLGFLSMNALRMHRTIRQSLLLQFENNDLVAHLDAEKGRIERLNEQLERRVAERTAEISAANAAKSRFLVAASHDLRQPLQTLSLLTAVLSKTVHEPDQTRAVHDMRDTVSVMSSLLDALLDVNKLDSGTIRPDVSDFSVGDLLDRLRLEFVKHARDKNLGLRVVSSSAIIRSDPVLLEHIVRNLLSNAIRYTNSGKVLLGCRRRGTRLRIEVRDTGIGIPPDQLDSVFEEFYQIDNPARDRSKGWGLGLAIVARSARLMGHHIDVQSVPGKGSMFAVEVPLGTAPGRPGPAREGAPGVGNDHREANIFLVEDEKSVRNAMRSMLELYDFRVDTAANPGEASRKLQALDAVPDLVIADYRLPMSGTGIDVIRDARKLTGAWIPGIILTGDISPQILHEAGAHHLAVMHKPAAPDELLALINKQLASKR